jgi:hypothetical protein
MDLDIGLSLDLSNRYFRASYLHLVLSSVFPHDICLHILTSQQLVKDSFFVVRISSVLNFTIVWQLGIIWSVKHELLLFDRLVIHVGRELRSMDIVVTTVSLGWTQRGVKETKQRKVVVRANSDACLPRVLLIHDPALAEGVISNVLDGLGADERFDITPSARAGGVISNVLDGLGADERFDSVVDKLDLFVDGWHQEELSQIDTNMSESPFIHHLPLFDRWVHEVTAEEEQELGIEQLFGCLLDNDAELKRINFLLAGVNSFDWCLYATVLEHYFTGHRVEECVLSCSSWFPSLIVSVEFL